MQHEGDTLTIPDYRGNNAFNTLGNFALVPRAGLLFLDFERGDALMLTGRVDILWDGPEVAAMPGAQRAWRVTVEAGRRLRSALPLRGARPAA
ncbi:MAG: pyridoxamine 5'-phosphate oxidase family protein [Pseudomonadota bacterium]